jgi:hypothetical protein
MNDRARSEVDDMIALACIALALWALRNALRSF